MLKTEILIIGSGGHGKVIADIVMSQDRYKGLYFEQWPGNFLLRLGVIGIGNN